MCTCASVSTNTVRLSHHSPDNHFTLYFRCLDWYYALFSACGIFCSCLDDTLNISVNKQTYLGKKPARSDYQTMGRERKIRRCNRNMLTLISLYSSWKDPLMRKGWGNLGLFCLEKAEGILSVLIYIYISNRWKSSGWGQAFFQWCPAKGQGAIGTIWNIRNSIWTWEITSSLWGLQRIWSKLPREVVQSPPEIFKTPRNTFLWNLLWETCFSRCYFNPFWFSNSIQMWPPTGSAHSNTCCHRETICPVFFIDFHASKYSCIYYEAKKVRMDADNSNGERRMDSITTTSIS